jgi:hypothetical protein
LKGGGICGLVFLFGVCVFMKEKKGVILSNDGWIEK